MFRTRNATYFLEFVPPGICLVEGDPDLGGGGDGTPPVVPPASGGTALGDLGDDGDDPPPPGPATWREDWREAFSGGDDKALARFKRYTTPENVAKALIQAQDRLRSGQYTGALPEDASPEEVSAYRKAAGVPDKPDGYGIVFPDDLSPTEADNAVAGAFQEHMHSKHVPPGAAKEAFAFYTQTVRAQREAAVAAAQEARLESMVELRKEFPGRELKRSMTIANEFLSKHFEGNNEALAALLTAKLPNGVAVGDSAPIIKSLIAMARAYADDEALIGGDAGGSGGQSIDDEYDALITENSKKALTGAKEARLNQLAEARATRAERASRRAA